MSLICEVVQRALTTGYLTIAAENQLRELLQTRYGECDRRAFLQLQETAMLGRVKQESREYFDHPSLLQSKDTVL